MEDTIDSIFDTNSGQIFRITYKNRDFQVRLLKRGLKRNVTEVDLLLDGVVQKMMKEKDTWHFEHGNDQELANDIWRAISLRYRIFA
ncbi:hypothetical protein [Chryseobacterium sp. Marseille-Q8038]